MFDSMVTILNWVIPAIEIDLQHDFEVNLYFSICIIISILTLVNLQPVHVFLGMLTENIKKP